MHSWRVLILPWLEQKAIYDRYRFDEPWDGPHNRTLHDLVVSAYACPSHPGKGHPTGYLAVVGPGTVWRGAGSVRLEEVVDGSSQTIQVVEVANSPIHWMEPRDLEIDRTSPAVDGSVGGSDGLSSGHRGGANVSLVDGSVRFLTAGRIAPGQLRALLTIAGGESVGEGP